MSSPTGQPANVLVATVNPATIADVLAQMQSIDARLPANDGLRWFNRLYMMVTQTVDEQTSAGAWKNPLWLAHLDVVFAGLYFDALRNFAAGQSAPSAWSAVFDARFTSGIDRIQFALAGMNAHINRDLAVALDTTWTRLGGSLDRNSPRCRDFLAINDILSAQMAAAKTELFSRVDRIADAALGPVDDVLEVWSIAAARDSAWTAGVALHKLGPGEAKDAAMQAMDRTASLIGRLLLL